MLKLQKCPVCGADLTLDAGGGQCLRCLWQLALAPEDPLPISAGDEPFFEQPGDRIGRYKLLQQIGEGGCGVVYMAEQEDPIRRRVALKVIKLGMDTKSVIARFEAERQAMALMDHLNIAKVLDAGATDSGRPFFVMELVRGVKITEFCDQNNLSTRERLDLFVAVCNAIQHAHQKGVIHRDIKPSNILVTLNDGVPIPKVIDFGIAKAIQQRLTDKTLFTAFEQFIGTPAYMSPEQAEMNASGIDTRSDIYSLGVLLYELLTGQTPFDAKTMLQSGIEEIRRIIREREPARPSTRLSTLMEGDLATTANHRRVEAPKLIHLVRGDLDWIVMKALEKDRARRYDTANGLAMDVQRHLNDEPVIARPPGNLYRFHKMVRRNKLAVSSTIAVLAALVVGLGVSTWQFVEKSRAEREQNRLRQEAQKAQANEAQLRRQAQTQELAARRKAYAVSMNLAQQALQMDNLGRATDLLNQQRPEPGQEDLRGWEWRYLWQFCRSDAEATVCTRSNLITSVSFSRDGNLLAVATEPGEVSVWEVASGKLVYRDTNSCDGVARVAFAPVGDLLAHTDQKNIIIWNSHSRTEVSRLPIGAPLNDMAFISGTRLLTAKMNETNVNNITVWDTTTALPVTNFTSPVYDNWVGTKFAASPDGNRMACAVSDKLVRVVDLAQGTNEWSFPATEEMISALAFSADGKILATGAGYTESAVKLWNVETHQFIGQLDGHRSWITYLKFLPDGTLASASADQTIRLWNVAARQPLRTFRGHHSEVRAFDVSRDGRILASGSKDGTVLLWDLASMTTRPIGWQTVDLKYKPGFNRGFDFSPDSRTIAVVEQGAVKLYDSASLRPLLAPDLGLTNYVSRLMFSPDSRLLVAIGSDGRMGVWDIPGQRQVTNFAAHAVSATLLGSTFLRGGKALLTCGADYGCKEWDVTTWQELAHWPLKDEATRLSTLYSATSASGLLAVKVNNRSSVMQIFPASDPLTRRTFTCPDRTVGVAFSPDENTLATVCEDGNLTLWDPKTLAVKAVMHSVLLGLHSVGFSPDGRRIVAGSNGKEAIKIWDFASRQELVTLEGKGSLFSYARFSPDGNMIAARNWNGILHLWRAPSWEEIKATEQGGPAVR